MLPEQKLDVLLARHATLEAELSQQLSSDTYVKLTRELSDLTPVIDAIRAYRAARDELADINGMIEDSSTDAEMRDIAQAEKPVLQERLEKLEQEIGVSLLPKDAMDERDVII